MGEYVSLHIIGLFGDESFQAITCTGTDNTKQTSKRKQRSITNQEI